MHHGAPLDRGVRRICALQVRTSPTSALLWTATLPGSRAHLLVAFQAHTFKTSSWVNAQNGPRTPIEEEGLNFVGGNPGKNFLPQQHVDTPKTDFALNDVMGGVVIRVPL